MGKLEYFNYSSKPKEILADKSLNADADVRMDDAKVPRPVLELLNDPTDQHAYGYLEWQMEKIERIEHAQEAIDRVLRKGK